MKGKEAAFFGKITAAMTHEIRNVLAIIQESTGLLQDVLSLDSSADFAHRERFSKTLGKIQNQVQRGKGLATALNKFAHSADEPVAHIDLCELVEQVVFLSQRFARQKNMTLQCDKPELPIDVETRPVRLQMALVNCLECFIGEVPGGETVVVAPEKDGKQARVLIECAGDDDAAVEQWLSRVTELPQWSSLKEEAEVLGGEVKCRESSYGVTLVLPLHPSE